MEDVPRIQEFLRDKKIFITGGTGFIGKVFVEKLLRSCPDVNTLYLLIRPKKSKSEEQRVQEMIESPLFETLRKQHPNIRDKIKIVFGDILLDRIGLSDADYDTLINEVDFVFHAAATIRFDITLKEAILLNTRGTREICKLVLEMKKLKVFLYVSTAYCNSHMQSIDEKLYPPLADWKETIKIAETLDDKVFDIFSKKYLSPLPNEYTFAKHLAEHVVNDMLNGNVPAVVVRPSIVVSSFSEPIPGWIDNFNGPGALLMAGGKGVLFTFYCKPETISNYIPVDLIVKAMLIAAAKKAYEKEEEKKILTIYHATANDAKSITFQELIEIGFNLVDEHPLEKMVWYPNAKATSSKIIYYINFLLKQLIPSVFIDMILWLIGYPPLLVRIQRKIYSANLALDYFITRQWNFGLDNVLGLEKYIHPDDYQDFKYTYFEADPKEFFRNAVIGGKRFLLKEFDDEAARKHAKIMWVVSKIAMVIKYVFLFWLLFYKIDIMLRLSQIYNRYYNYLCEL